MSCACKQGGEYRFRGRAAAFDSGSRSGREGQQQEVRTTVQTKASVRNAIMSTSAGGQLQMAAADRAVPRFGAATVQVDSLMVPQAASVVTGKWQGALRAQRIHAPAPPARGFANGSLWTDHCRYELAHDVQPPSTFVSNRHGMVCNRPVGCEGTCTGASISTLVSPARILQLLFVLSCLSV